MTRSMRFTPQMGTGAARGFTLVEVVAATALSAVLLTVVLAVVRTVHRPAGGTADDAVSLAVPLADQLRWDVANAIVMRAGDRGLTLVGYGSLDPATLAPTREPTAVTYAVRTVGGRAWLVREQSALDARAEGGTWSELVAADVAGLTVDAPASAADASAATRPAAEDPTPLAFRLAGVRPVPPRVRFTVRFADRSAVEAEAWR